MSIKEVLSKYFHTHGFKIEGDTITVKECNVLFVEQLLFNMKLEGYIVKAQ